MEFQELQPSDYFLKARQPLARLAETLATPDQRATMLRESSRAFQKAREEEGNAFWPEIPYHHAMNRIQAYEDWVASLDDDSRKREIRRREAASIDHAYRVTEILIDILDTEHAIKLTPEQRRFILERDPPPERELELTIAPPRRKLRFFEDEHERPLERDPPSKREVEPTTAPPRRKLRFFEDELEPDQVSGRGNEPALPLSDSEERVERLRRILEEQKRAKSRGHGLSR